MARTQTVQEMVSNLRAEAGHSLSVAQGTNTEATLKYILKRTQEELWAAFVWPELMIRDDRPMTPGVRTYDYSTNLKFDAIRQAFSARPNSGAWTEVGYGIGEDQLDAGTLDNSTRSDPVQFWEANGDKFNVWPTPVASGNVLRFKGNRELQPFQSSSDRSTLDATADHPVRGIRAAGPFQGRGRRQQVAESPAPPDQAARQSGLRQEQAVHLWHRPGDA